MYLKPTSVIIYGLRRCHAYIEVDSKLNRHVKILSVLNISVRGCHSYFILSLLSKEATRNHERVSFTVHSRLKIKQNDN